MIKIPTSYQLVSTKWTTHWDGMPDDETNGYTDFEAAENRIRSGKPQTYTHHTFYHELSHQLLEAVGRPDLSEDEGLVDALGGALHQYMQTKRGNLEAIEPGTQCKKRTPKTS